MKLDVKIIGAQALMKLMKKKGKIIDKNLGKDLLKCVIKVEGDAKRNAPVLTGRLRSSLTHEVKKMVGKVGTNVDYAPPVEFGTSKMSAQPYLFPALRKNFNFIRKKLGKSVVTSLKKGR